MEQYPDSLTHILAELERIDLLISAQVCRARQLSQVEDEFQAFCVSEGEINALLAEPIGLPRWAREQLPLSLPEVRKSLEQISTDIARRKAESARRGIRLRLDELARHFDLTAFEIDILLICLAQELDLRYERLYAYLQNDITKKYPSVDLVLNLLCPSFSAKVAARQRFMPSAPLLKHNLLHLFKSSSHQQAPLLSQFLKVDERIVHYLLDGDEIEARLLPYVRLGHPSTLRQAQDTASSGTGPILGGKKEHTPNPGGTGSKSLEELLLPADVKRRLGWLVQPPAPILYFQGSYGVGKQTTAVALCREVGVGLLVVDGERLLDAKEMTFATAVQLVAREALLQNAALYWTGFDALLSEDKLVEREDFLRVLEEGPAPTFLAGESTWEPQNALHKRDFVRFDFPRPAYDERVQLWTTLLNEVQCGENVDIAALANKFRFSGGQIRDAVATARHLARSRDPQNGQVTMSDLYAACRLQSNRNLSTLAQKIKAHYTWDDIVLPADRLSQLREICNYVKYRAIVYSQWGFDRKLSLGKGLNVLFSGPSGTGKTMAAEIIANELGLELYKIDLSTVVSKYIGETEKNLSRIFSEAESSNAILLFDEADALFGKRTEVRDSHDRHANIEISYLLQRMEEYEGIVILTSNLRKNMDNAFMRRIQFTIEFPFPTERYRRRIWKRIWPNDTPRSPDLDLDFMARHFELAGGNIRNIALAAAFLAAADGQSVGMTHLIHAIRREYQKMGKVVMAEEFGKYSTLFNIIKINK